MPEKKYAPHGQARPAQLSPDDAGRLLEADVSTSRQIYGDAEFHAQPAPFSIDDATALSTGKRLDVAGLMSGQQTLSDAPGRPFDLSNDDVKALIEGSEIELAERQRLADQTS